MAPSSPKLGSRAGLKRMLIRKGSVKIKRKYGSARAGASQHGSASDCSSDVWGAPCSEAASEGADYGAQHDPKLSISGLPEDVLIHILSFLEKRELVLTVPLVCRTWRDLAREPVLWRELHLSKYGGSVTDGVLARVAEHCVELHTLDLSRCSSFGIEGLRSLAGVGSSLRRLDLTGCGGVKMECLPALGLLPCLEHLAVSNTEILRRATERTIPALPRLSSLSISGIALDGALLAAVATAWGRSLTRLVAREIYNLSPDTVFAFCATPHLRELDFQISRGACWTTAAPIGRLTELERLSLPDALDEEAREACSDLSWVAPLRRLRELRVGTLALSEAGVAALASLPVLSRLRLTLAAFPHRPLAAALARIPHLSSLTLRDAQGAPFPAPFWDELPALPALRALKLRLSALNDAHALLGPGGTALAAPAPAGALASAVDEEAPPRLDAGEDDAPPPSPGSSAGGGGGGGERCATERLAGALLRQPALSSVTLKLWNGLSFRPAPLAPVVARLAAFQVRVNESCLIVGDRACLYAPHVAVHVLATQPSSLPVPSGPAAAPAAPAGPPPAPPPPPGPFGDGDVTVL